MRWEEAPGARWHLVLPESSDKVKNRALRSWQLGSAEPGPGLLCALQSPGGCLEGTFDCTSGLLHQLPRLGPSWLRLLVKGQGQVLRDGPTMDQSRLGSEFYLLPLTPLLLRWGMRGLLRPLQLKPNAHSSVFIPFCPSKYLTAFSKALCMCPGYVFCVDEWSQVCANLSK